MSKDNTNNNFFTASNYFGIAMLVLASALAGMYIFQLWITGILTMALGVALLFSSEMLKTEKTRVKNGNADSQGAKRYENILLALYLPLLVGSFILVFHFVDVDFVRRTDFISTALKKLETIPYLKVTYQNQVEKEINDFSTSVDANLGDFQTSMDKTVSQDNLKTLFVGLNDKDFEDIQKLKTKIMALKTAKIDEKRRKYNSKAVFAESDVYYDKVKVVFLNWTRFEVQKNYADIDRMYEKTYNLAKGKMPHLELKSTTLTDDLSLSNPFKALANFPLKSILGALLYTLIAYFLVLFPYFKSERKVFSHHIAPSNPHKKIPGEIDY